MLPVGRRAGAVADPTRIEGVAQIHCAALRPNALWELQQRGVGGQRLGGWGLGTRRHSLLRKYVLDWGERCGRFVVWVAFWDVCSRWLWEGLEGDLVAEALELGDQSSSHSFGV